MQKASQRNSHLHLYWSKQEGHWSLGVTMIGVTWHFPSNMHNSSHILLLQILKASWREHKQYFHTWLPVSHANWKRETMKYLFWKKKNMWSHWNKPLHHFKMYHWQNNTDIFVLDVFHANEIFFNATLQLLWLNLTKAVIYRKTHAASHRCWEKPLNVWQMLVAPLSLIDTYLYLYSAALW